MTVQQLFESESIDLDDIDDTFTGEVGEKDINFITLVWQNDIENMNGADRARAERILQTCVERKLVQ